MTLPRFVEQTPFYQLADVGNTLEVPLPAHRPRDIFLAIFAFYVPNLGSGPPIVNAPPGWEHGPKDPNSFIFPPVSQVVMPDARGWVGVVWRRALTDSETNPVFARPAVSSPLSNTTFAVSIALWRHVDPSSTPYDMPWNPSTSGGESSPPADTTLVTVAGADRLAVQVLIATYGNLAVPSPGPSAYTLERETHGLITRGASAFVYTKPTSVNVPSNSFDVTVATEADLVTPKVGYAVIGFAWKPDLSPPVTFPPGPVLADPRRLSLDCVSDYQAFITQGDYRTTIDAVGWSSINWSRTLDDISEAEVRLPDELGGAYCIAKFGGLVPWRYGLLIERNGQEVWSGPVIGVDRPEGDDGAVDYIVVSAADTLARYRKRLATDSVSLEYVNRDAGSLLAEVVDHCRHPFDLWELRFPNITTGTPLTRTIIARQFEYVWDVIKEMFDAAVDGFVINNKIYLYEPRVGWRYLSDHGELLTLEGPYNSVGDMVYGLFTEEAFVKRPGWSISGAAQTNRAWVPGADSGEAGFRKFWTQAADNLWPFDGVLDMVDADVLYRPSEDDAPTDETVFQRHADSMIALRATAPAVINRPTLAEGAPIDVPNLRPGSIWALDVHDAGWGQLLQLSRLKRVDVDVSIDDSGLVEKIQPTLFPLGFTEEP